jgi:hypothetical protein
MKTLKTELVKFIDGDMLDIYELSVKNWPVDDDGEQQDIENYEILSIDDDKMVMCCGGDWQEPMKITIELVDDKLTVTGVEKGIFEEGLDSDEILLILTK